MFNRVREGMDVLDREGKKIGKAGESLPEAHSFNVDTGFLGIGREYYVPYSAIRDVQDRAIYVDVRKDELRDMGWDQKPTASAAEGERDVNRPTEEGQVRLREEKLEARKTPVEAGQVHVGKDVVEEERSLEVPVTREEVYFDRRSVDRRPADEAVGHDSERAIEVPLREERLDVHKQPVVYEEVGVGKRQVQENRQVSDRVRREELRTRDDHA